MAYVALQCYSEVSKNDGGNGDSANCTLCIRTREMSSIVKILIHTLKIWEKVIKVRLRKVVRISENQFGFMIGRSSMEIIHFVRRLIKAHRDRKNLFFK